MKPFKCTCSNVLFFENTFCVKCGTSVGYDDRSDSIKPLQNDAGLKLCANGLEHGVCNWLVPADGPQALCAACQLNRTIPDLSTEESKRRWAKMESAKHRLVYSMHHLGLKIPTRSSEPEVGLVFDFLQPTPETPVLTGHDDGIITMNLEEADDAIREANRQTLHEPHRSLVGHFRHELAHYYWWLWFEQGTIDTVLLNSYREVFGDEREDYDTALGRYYQQGAPADWQQNYISEYATAHSWEDWAETWAHYLHIKDAMETADTFGLSQGRQYVQVNPFPPGSADLPAPFADFDATPFLEMINHWGMLTPAINELSQSLGQRDLYPFVITPAIARKLYFVHCAITRVRQQEPTLAAPASSPAHAPIENAA